MPKLPWKDERRKILTVYWKTQRFPRSQLGKTERGGRPRKDEKLSVHYFVDAKAVRNEEIVLNEKEYQGRFIIASNDLNLDAEKMLENYKNQSKVEKGFRFIK